MVEIKDQVKKIRHSSREMVRELGFMNQVMESVKLHPSQCHTLIELKQHGILKVGQLAEILRIDKSTASRTVKTLLSKEWIQTREDQYDSRSKLFAITDLGEKILSQIETEATDRVENALKCLSDDEIEKVVEGLSLYSKGLKQSQKQAEYKLREIEPKDNTQVEVVIRRILGEFGLNREGFASQDNELKSMYEAYQGDKASYYVLTKDEKIVGCGGVAPLLGGPEGVCELKKLYLLPETRGLGLGARVLTQSLKAAKELGYQQCYLETVKEMARANVLYLRFGFQPLQKAMGATGHHGCSSWFLKDL